MPPVTLDLGCRAQASSQSFCVLQSKVQERSALAALQAVVCCLDSLSAAPDVAVATKKHGLQLCVSSGGGGHSRPSARSVRFAQAYEEVCPPNVRPCLLRRLLHLLAALSRRCVFF